MDPKSDNAIDSSDSPVFEETEVSALSDCLRFVQTSTLRSIKKCK